MYALDLYTGRKIWQYKTEGQISSSPAVYNGAVYFGSTDDYVYSLNVKKGKLRWRFKTGGMVIATPTIDKDIVYIGSTDHKLYAIPA
jgi:outer membrane protein assembly factor BamB